MRYLQCLRTICHVDRVVVLLLLVCLSGILVLGVCRFCGGFLFCGSAGDRNQQYGILLKAFRLEMAFRICLADIIDSNPVCLGNGEQCLFLHHDMRPV